MEKGGFIIYSDEVRSILVNFLESKLFDLFAIIVIILVFGIGYLLSGRVPYYFNSDLSGTASYVIDRSNELENGVIFNPWWDVTSRPAFNIDPSFFVQLEVFLYLVTRNIWLNYKLLQIIQLILSGISMYLLAHFYTRNRFCSFIAAILYMLTPYSLGKLAVHANSISWAYSLLPLGYLSIEKVLSTSRVNIRNILIAGLIVALTTFLPSFNYIYINGLFYLFFIILRASSRGRLKNIGKKLFVGISILVIASAISSYAVIPTLLEPFPQSTIGQFDLERRYQEGLSGVWSTTMIEALSLQDKEIIIHGESTGRFSTIMEPWVLFLSTYTLFVATAVFLFRHNKATHQIVFAYSLVGLLSVMFALGPKVPLIQPYIWFHNVLPLFYTVRQTCRFEIHFVLASVFLASITINKILQRLGKLKFNLEFFKINVLPHTIIVMLVIPSIVGACYNLTTGPAHLLQTVALPNDVMVAQQFWEQQLDMNDYRVLDLTVPSDYFDQTYNIGTHGLYYGWDLVEKYYDTPYFAAALVVHNVKYLLYDPIKTQQLLLERGLDPNVFINNVLNNQMDWKAIKIYGSDLSDHSTLIIDSSPNWFFRGINESIATPSNTVIYKQATHKVSNITVREQNAEAKIIFYLTRLPENQILLVKVENKDDLEIFRKEVNSSNLNYGWNEIEMKNVTLNPGEYYGVLFSAPYADENNNFFIGVRKTERPSICSWSLDEKDWTPYGYGSDMLVNITHESLPKNLKDIIANYDDKSFVLTLCAKFDPKNLENEFYILKKSLSYSTYDYRSLIYKARTSDPNTQVKLEIIYSDGTSTATTYSGLVWRTLTIDLQTNKTITEIRLFIEPVNSKKIDENYHLVNLGTTDLYVLENKKVLPAIYPSKGYWLEKEGFVAFNPKKHYSVDLNFSTEAILESVFDSTTNIEYDYEQKRMYFVNPGSVVWRFEVSYPIIEGVVRAKLGRNILEGSDIRLYVSSDNVNWVFLGNPKKLGETNWIAGKLIKNATIFYVKIESPVALGGSIFGLQIYAELDVPEIPVQITYYEESPTEYIVHVNASSPFYLIFTETYFPGWILYLDSYKVSPIPFDSNTLIAFHLNRTGSYTVNILYKSTLIRRLAFLASGVFFLLVISVVIYPVLRNLFENKKIFQTVKNRVY